MEDATAVDRGAPGACGTAAVLGASDPSGALWQEGWRRWETRAGSESRGGSLEVEAVVKECGWESEGRLWLLLTHLSLW